MRILYLDDTRTPVNAIEQFKDWEWFIVRNYDNFVSHIEQLGIPDVISFDHDLGEDDARNWVDLGLFSKRKARKKKKEVKSGYDCASWLVDYCFENNLPPKEIYVHSMNPGGAQRIMELLNDLKVEFGQAPDCKRRILM